MARGDIQRGREVMSYTVAFTAAFFVGPPVQTRMGEYGELHRSLGEMLVERGGATWKVPERLNPHARPTTFSGGGGLTDAVPLLLVTRDWSALQHDQQPAEVRWLTEEPPPSWAEWAPPQWKWTAASFALDNFHVEVYDLGMAVLSVTFTVLVPSDCPRRAAAEALKRLADLDPSTGSPIASICQELADETAKHYVEVIESEVPYDSADPWLDAFLESAVGPQWEPRRNVDEWGRLLWRHPVIMYRGAEVDEWGRLLWLHPVIVYEGDDVLSAARELSPPFRRSMRMHGGRFVAGVGWSAVITEKGRSKSVEVPLRLLQVHWAYFALYMHLDRALGEELARGRWREAKRLSERERDADHLFGYYQQVGELRRRLDSMPVNRGGDEFAMWEAISDVQKFDALVDVVERKSELLWRVSERAVQRAEADRVRRTSVILGALTALTVVTVAVALTGNFLGGRTDSGHSAWRVAIVVVAGLIALGIGWLVRNEGTWSSASGGRGACSDKEML